MKDDLMRLNDPAAVAGVKLAFERYEAALVGNDIAALDALFLDSDTTVRFGGAENLYGSEAIRTFRAGRSALGLARRLERTVLTTYGASCAVVSTLFYRDDTPGRVGRQMQTWILTDKGWKVAAAHVSTIEQPT